MHQKAKGGTSLVEQNVEMIRSKQNDDVRSETSVKFSPFLILSCVSGVSVFCVCVHYLYIHAFYFISNTFISNTRLKFANFQNLSRKILRTEL